MAGFHEIKHDGFRILAHRQGRAVRLMSRNGHDLASRFPQIVEALRSLPVQSCVVDGEAIVTNDKGLAVFDLLRKHHHHAGAELCAFDMIELDGEDMRRAKLEERKRMLARLLGRFQPGIIVNEYFEGDGMIIYKHACALGCEGIVQSGSGRRTAPAGRIIGSRSRTRMRRRCGGWKKKIGTDDGPPLPAALDGRRNRPVLHRARRQSR
jgi:bifunctional non-homologous end joining protein LigD